MMVSSNEERELIRKFLRKELSPGEMRSVKTRMENDEHFAQKVTEEILAQRDKVKPYNESEKFKGRMRRKLLDWRYVAFIAFAAFVFGLFWLNTYSEKERAESLFDDFFEPYRAPELITDKQDDWTKSMKFYSKGEYSRCSAMLMRLSNLETLKPEQNFYLGISLLASDGNPEKAIKAFRKVFEVKNDYQEASEWYLSLAYLKAGDLELSRNILWDIARKPDGYLKTEARRLLDKLLDLNAGPQGRSMIPH